MNSNLKFDDLGIVPCCARVQVMLRAAVSARVSLLNCLLLLRSAMNAFFAHFLRAVHSEYFAEFPLWCTPEGRVVGEFIKVRLESRFVAAFDEEGQPLGVVAGLHAIAPGGESIGSEALSRLTRVSETPQVLDRFIRCLHLLNYLQGEHAGSGLVLPVSALLLETVSQDHGRVFRQIVDQLDLPAQRIGFLLPASLAAQPDRLALLRNSYAHYGFASFLALAEAPATVLTRIGGDPAAACCPH